MPLSINEKENMLANLEKSSNFPSNGSLVSSTSTSPERYRKLDDNNWWTPFHGISIRGENYHDTYAVSKTYQSCSSLSSTSSSMTSWSNELYCDSNQQTNSTNKSYENFKVFIDETQDSILSPLQSFSSTDEVSEPESTQTSFFPGRQPVKQNDFQDLWFDKKLEGKSSEKVCKK